MGFFDFALEAGDESLWLYGLITATVVLMSLGDVGLGVGAAFNAWGYFLDVIKAVIGINVVFGIINLVISLLPLLIIVAIGLGGTSVFSKLFGDLSASNTIAALGEKASIQNILIFLAIVFVLL